MSCFQKPFRFLLCVWQHESRSVVSATWPFSSLDHSCRSHRSRSSDQRCSACVKTNSGEIHGDLQAYFVLQLHLEGHPGHTKQVSWCQSGSSVHSRGETMEPNHCQHRQQFYTQSDDCSPAIEFRLSDRADLAEHLQKRVSDFASRTCQANCREEQPKFAARNSDV